MSSIQDVRTQTRVFISYSRRDLAVAQDLRDRLIDSDFDAYLDIHDIVKGEPWRERLRGLIERADIVLFLISPDSVASEICEWEINEAELDEKRLLPVVT
ncbi:MAG: toll/interleukin-1 receptor domain-containing protein [Chromatiaceae bacterium]